MCQRFGLDVTALDVEWGTGIPIEQYAEILRKDSNHQIKAELLYDLVHHLENKNNVPVFAFSIIAIILGVVLYRQFNFETLKFEKPALAILYLIVFVFSVFVLVKNFIKNRSEK